MGRNTSGVKGLEIDKSHVIGADVIDSSQSILVVTDKGYGKITSIDQYRLTHRGSKGVKALNSTDKNGNLVGLVKITTVENNNLIIVTNSGIVMKMPLSQVSVLNRNTQGTRLINLKDNQVVSTVTIVEDTDEEIETTEE